MDHQAKHSQSNADEVSKKIAEILLASTLPLSHRDIGVRLRTKLKRVPDYEVISNLRLLMKAGQAEYSAGRWSGQIDKDTASSSATIAAGISLPPLSDESVAMFGQRQIRPSKPYTDVEVKLSGFEWSQIEDEETSEQLQTGTWATFRKLVSYYRQCIRNEEGADASAFQNELGKRFVYLRKTGPWYPRIGLPWRICLAIGPHMSPMLNALPHSTDDQSLVVGYPVQAFYKEKEGEPDIAIIRPVFYFSVEHKISRDGLMVSCDNPRVEVNLGWLDYAFSRNLDRQRSFLSACGFINRSRPIDEAIGLEKGEISPSLDTLVSALAAFMSEKICQQLDIDSVPDNLLKVPFKNGIYTGLC